MRLLKRRISLLWIIPLLAGCGAPVGTPTATSPQVTLPTAAITLALPTQPAVIPTMTPAPLPSPAATQAATGANPSATVTSAISSPTQAAPVTNDTYLDDRSTPNGLVQSLFNAISRKEYLRAYSYWEDPAVKLGSFSAYEQGFQDTASARVTLGTISAGAGAGNQYFTVPAVLHVQTNAGTEQLFTGCYTLHLASPQLQAQPPFHPLAIQSAQVRSVSAGQTDEQMLASAGCEASGSPYATPPATNTSDLSANNYLDERSTPENVLRSLFNAINRKEYARAYSYWQAASNQVPSFDQFAQGYQNTASVEVHLGTPSGDAGAGQLRSLVPVVLIAQTSAGQTQTFAGCYQLHLSQPAMQATPPFAPWGIEKAEVQQVDNGVPPESLLPTSCAGMQ